MTRKLGLVVVLAALCACSSELASSGIPDASTPDSSVPPDDCTDGVDCVCDTERMQQSDVLHCQDWEHAAFYEPEHALAPWRSPAGRDHFRGGGGIFRQTYGPAGSPMSWHRGAPPDPQFGFECGADNCAVAVWRTGDPFDCPKDNFIGPSTGHYCGVGIVREDEFDDDEPSITSPTAPPAGGGDTSVWWRVPKGNGASLWPAQDGPFDRAITGTAGTIDFPGPQSEVGFTFALALASNAETSGVMDSPWKFHQFLPDGQHWYAGVLNNASNDPKLIPFRPGIHTTNCAQATAPPFQAVVGNFACPTPTGPSLYYAPEQGTGANQYDQPTDFPYGSWGCVRSHWKADGGLVTVKIWFTPEGGTEDLIIHLQDIDGAGLVATEWDGMFWNHYANHNQQTGRATTVTTGRFEDNHVLVAGPPVSCEEIGFDGTSM